MLEKTDMVEAGAPCWKKNDMVVCFKPELGEKLASEKNDMIEPGEGKYRILSPLLWAIGGGPVRTCRLSYGR